MKTRTILTLLTAEARKYEAASRLPRRSRQRTLWLKGKAAGLRGAIARIRASIGWQRGVEAERQRRGGR